jgi:outer membrane protein assembly factor BamB
VLASNPGGIVVLDPIGDSTRWRYKAPGGCRLIGAQPGSTGVAVLEHCAGADGLQLRLFGGFEGEKKWNVDLPVTEADAEDARLLGANGVVTVAVAGAVHVFATADGSQLSELPTSGNARQGAAGGVPLVLIDGVLSALDPTTGRALWTMPALGLPGASPADKETGNPTTLLVPETGGFVRRDAATGAELGRSAVADLPAGGVPEAVGPVVVYRLDDRVLAYR